MCNSLVEFISCPPDLVDILSPAFAEGKSPLGHHIHIYGPVFDTSRPLLSDSAYNILVTDTLPPPELAASLADIWFLPLSPDEAAYRIKMFLRRVELENQVAQDQALIHNLTDSSPNLIWIKDMEGHHNFVNESFCRAVGKAKDTILGKTHSFIWDVPEDDPACIESERIVMETGRNYISEESIMAGGEKRILTVHKAPLRDARGQITGTLGIAIDCTRERQYRDHLVQSGAALDAFFSSLDCGLVYHTPQFAITDMNPAARAMLGYPSLKALQETNGGSFLELVTPEDRDRVRELLESLTEPEESTSFECALTARDGEVKYVFAKSTLLSQNDAPMFGTYLLDCTTQKLHEERQTAERRAQQTELVRALGADYEIVLWRDLKSGVDKIFHIEQSRGNRLERIFSGPAPLREKLELYIQQCVHPDDREAFRKVCTHEYLHRQLKNSPTTYHNYRIVLDTGIKYCQMKVARMGDEKLFGFVMGLSNVDEQTRQEMEDRERLAVALVQAKKASRAKSTFLSNMSHDIRTPLNAIVGYTSLALRQVDETSPISPYLEKILHSGHHLISLINDILDMSHIESGKLLLRPGPCKMTDIVEELEGILQPLALEKDQNLVFETTGLTLDGILCDRLHLKQILLNLVSNAIKYTPEKGTIDIHIAQTDSPGERISFLFHIRDNGIGMTPEFLAKIFEPFERERTSTVAGIQGTGLGMAIAKSITEMMGGELDVKSEVGVGTEFILRVAFPKAAEEVQELLDAGEYTLDGGKLLLAEDNEMNQEIALEFLTSAGYEVDVANNGQEALEKLQTNGDYDLVLMDVQMPVMDGYTAVRAIRALPDRTLASIPILAMTANSFEEDRQAALASGMNGHVAKPIDFNQLFRTLHRFLAKTPKASQAI